MFDALIDQTEKEMARNFTIMRRIKADRFATGQNKEAKLAPLVQEITTAKDKIIEMLMRKNNMIQWYDKLPQEH